MTADNQRRNTQTLAIAIGAGALVILAIVTIMAIAMGGIMDGCGDMARCHGGRGADQTPAVLNGAQVTIEIRDYDFSPRDATITAGATVAWANEDKAPHDATIESSERLTTGTIRVGDTGSITLAEPGQYEYYCSIHPYMKGNLTVRD